MKQLDAIRRSLRSYRIWSVLAGFVLTCQAHPVSDRVVVDYDHV